MSEPRKKIFGLSVGVNPVFILVGLLIVAAIVFWTGSSNSDQGDSGAAARTRAPGLAPVYKPVTHGVRRAPRVASGAVIRLRPVDPADGSVDPSLQLDLLARLRDVQPRGEARNLFQTGASAAPGPDMAKLARDHRIVPKPPPIVPTVQPTVPSAPVPNIPLRFYGYAKPREKGEVNRGFFLDGDNVLVAAEGQLVDKRYLVVELTPLSARLEDIQLKMSQTLPVVQESRDE
jgi:hypothetical protein